MTKLVDFMAIGAHADDVEIMAGGTVARLCAEGKAGVIVDMTDASMGTRGSVELRLEEAEKARQVLGIKTRVNLGLPDGHLSMEPDYVERLVQVIREHRPRIILTHWNQDEHPDHVYTSKLVEEAVFKAGLIKFGLGEAFRPSRLFFFMGAKLPTEGPKFCVDISNFWETKKKALGCYASQFAVPGAEGHAGKTDIATPEFMQYIETRARYFGNSIKSTFAEPFYCYEIPEVQDLTALSGKRFG